MGMYDEVYCYAALPDGRDPRGTCFQKSFPDPCMCRYRIASAGRLIDSAGNDLEPDGYITFYTVDRDDGDIEAPGRIPGLREYRARFLSGQRRQWRRELPIKYPASSLTSRGRQSRMASNRPRRRRSVVDALVRTNDGDAVRRDTANCGEALQSEFTVLVHVENRHMR